jgi:hypothetical protein
VEKSGPPDQLLIGPGAFFLLRAAPFRRKQMENKELAFTKQAILATKDWDTYQAIIRKCLRIPEYDSKCQEKPGKL